jgi:hypothetical protein
MYLMTKCRTVSVETCPMQAREPMAVCSISMVPTHRPCSKRSTESFTRNPLQAAMTNAADLGSLLALAGAILPVLAATLKPGPVGELAFICGDRGKPLTKESFGNLFRKVVRAAGIEGKSAHGLCKVGATRAAENGATVAELEAIFGWKGGRMASLYTEAANRARLAKQAIGKLANEPETNSPSPNEKVRGSKLNTK